MAWRLINERGGLFGFALIMALVFSISAYSVLFVASSQARQGGALGARSRARYAAEAGIIIAKESLWSNPGYCTGNPTIDTNGDGVDDTVVNVSVIPCGAGIAHEIRAQVVY